MCGLIGTAGVNPLPDMAPWLRAGRDALAHRGPDDAGEWWSRDLRVGLGHRRLAIIDLSAAGHQPMRMESKGLTVAFNGEIYNFRELRSELEGRGYEFRSHSDTEVLLAGYDAWGADLLPRLKGMFVFALHDEPRQRVLLARDRAGEKPLFYHLAGGRLDFASELKGLLANPALPRRIDPAALDCYLSMGFVPGSLCILQGFSKLPAAHALCFHLRTGEVRTWRYWDLPAVPDPARCPPEQELLDELELLLEGSVKRQMVADVPVGVLLSGGVDSSVITAMAVRHAREVRTFTIRFPGHPGQDETEHARLVSRHFGTQHTELTAEPQHADLLPLLARQYDEPIVDSSMLPTFLVSRLVRQHCTVALGGDGGDELFAGYEHYSRLLWMQKRLTPIPSSLRKLVSRGAEHLLPVGLKGRNWLQALGSDLGQGVPLIASYFDDSTRRKLLALPTGQRLPADAIRIARMPQDGNLLELATRMDFTDYLAEDILVKVDRASMLNSLEVRAPMLDADIIEFAFGRVPADLKASAHDKKILLKRLAARVLPADFDRHRKQGFSIPLAQWLEGGPFKSLFWEILTDPRSIFDQTTTQGLLRGQELGRSNSERLFALVQFELWRREYGITL